MPTRIAAVLLLLACASSAGATELPQYTLRYDATARTMQVSLCLADALAAVRFAGDGSAPRNVDTPTRSSAAPLLREGAGWTARDWRAGECLNYRADLGRISDARERSSLRVPGTVTDPAGWLLMADVAESADARLDLPNGTAISTPWQPLPSPDGTRRFHIARTPPDWLGRLAIGSFAEHTITLEGGRLHVAIGGTPAATQRDHLLDWLRRVSRASLSAYGRMPLADVQILVIPVGAQHEAVVFGQSARGQGNGLTLFVDPAHSATAFDRDWVAVHELSHLFHPHLGGRGAWLAEGLATYYQNVLRARAGLLTPAQAWEELADGFARGAHDTPASTKRTLEDAAAGMEDNGGFFRVYWSGTAYWLDVDIELRRANHPGIDEALRRFDACCLPSAHDWTPQAFVAKLDALSDTTMFTQRFRAYQARRDFPDIAPAFAALGIRASDGAALPDASAESRRLRDAIMSPAR
jgi:hypothetical protein